MNNHFAVQASECYLSVDFEILNRQWWTCALILVEYPSGNVIRSLVTGHSNVQFNNVGAGPDSTNETFWRANPDAYHENLRISSGCSKMEAEKQIVNFVTSVKLYHPRFYAISDNPSVDIGTLDDILTRHSLSRLSSRNNHGLYLQCICTWSHRMTLKSIMQLSNKELDTLLDCHRIKINIGTSDHRKIIKHTPFGDALHGLEQFLTFRSFTNTFKYVHVSANILKDK